MSVGWTVVILSNLASLLFGYVVGRLICRNKETGKWQMDVKRVNGGVALGLLVAILAVISLAFTTYNNERQQDCNQQVISAITVRSQLTDEDRKVASDARENVSRLVLGVAGFIATPETNPGDSEAIRQLFIDYRAEQQRIDAELQRLSDARAANPVPTVNCDNL